MNLPLVTLSLLYTGQLKSGWHKQAVIILAPQGLYAGVHWITVPMATHLELLWTSLSL